MSKSSNSNILVQSNGLSFCDNCSDGLNSIKGVTCNNPGGAFYVFPNISGTGMNGNEFADKCLNEAGVAIIPGVSFGKSAKDFVRFSFANSYENIEKALEKIKKTVVK